jgi:hypothetical protein
MLALHAETVELTVPDAADERVPLVRREPENGTRGIPAVPDADIAG